MASSTHLGRLGTVHDATIATFDWWGAVVRTNPDTSPELELTEFMNKAAAIELPGDVDIDDPAALAKALPQAVGAMDSVLGLIQALIHPQDWPEFYRLAKKHRQDVKDLMDVAMRLVEAASAVPSGRPSVSSDGRPRTTPKSRAGSSSPATRALSLVDSPYSLAGRPDLQAAIVQAEQARHGGRAASG